METPVIRWRDSARLASGNLPMSSAEIASTTPIESRLISIEAFKLPRMPPSTIISSITASSSCAKAGEYVPTNAKATLDESKLFLNTILRPLKCKYVIRIILNGSLKTLWVE